MATVPGNLREQLLRDEGKVLHAYQDSEGYWTIGVGRLIDEQRGGGISHDEALYLLENDIAKVEDQLEKALPWSMMLDPVREAVLVNMAFSMGMAGLLKFVRFLAAMQDHDWPAAGIAMLDSVWARQVPIRAQRLARQIASGEWQ